MKNNRSFLEWEYEMYEREKRAEAMRNFYKVPNPTGKQLLTVFVIFSVATTLVVGAVYGFVLLVQHAFGL